MISRSSRRAGIDRPGCSFYRTREQLARGYIREDWTVTEVAFTLGFSDTSSFSRAFRRWTGVAPTEFAAPYAELSPKGVRCLRPLPACYYSDHKATMKLKVARIGNSRGVRLPAGSLRRYRIGETVVMEERSDGILLRPTGPAVEKLSWQETARAMAASREDWRAWDAVAKDGLDDLPWLLVSTPILSRSRTA